MTVAAFGTYTETVQLTVGGLEVAVPSATTVVRAYAPTVGVGAAVSVPVAYTIMRAYAPTIPVEVGELSAALFARLSGYSGIASLAGARVYPVVAPQDARLPLVRYRLIIGTPTSVFGEDVHPSRAIVQIGVAGKTYASAKAVARQVRTALKRWSGTEEGVVVQQAFLVRELDGPWDPDLEAYTVEQDYEIWHEGWT